MAHSQPFDQLTGPLQVYIAPVDSTVPDIDAAPTSPWVELAETDGEQSLQHAGALAYFYDNAHQGPRKSVRPDEEVIATFTLVSLTLEHYARILDAVGDVVEDAVSDPNTKTLPLERGFTPSKYALLFRGAAASPYGAWPALYVIPRGVFDGEPQPTFATDGRPALECEFHALEDISQDEGDELGWLVVQPPTVEEEENPCLLAGIPDPSVIATYAPVLTDEVLCGVAIDLPYAYVCIAKDYVAPGGLHKVLVADGNGVALTGTLSATATMTDTSIGFAEQCAVSGDYVYIASWNGLFVVNKNTMALVGSCRYIAGYGDDPFLQHIIISTDGNYAICGGSGFGWAIFDISDPANPAGVFFDGNVDCEELLYTDDHVYIVDDWWHVCIYDIATPASPIKRYESFVLLRGSAHLSGWAISATRNLLVLSDFYGRDVKIYDISTRFTPVLQSTLVVSADGSYEVQFMQIVGKYLILATLHELSEGGDDLTIQMRFVDISDPTNPTQITTLDFIPDNATKSEDTGWFDVWNDRYIAISAGYTAVKIIDCC